MKIQLADDELQIRRLNKAILESGGYTEDRGFRYIETSSGQTTWKSYLDDRPDLMILDNSMKDDLTGLEIARRIRYGSDESEPDMRTIVIMYTSSLSPTDVQEMHRIGVDYLEKPANLDDFLSKFKSHLDREPVPTEKVEAV